MLRKIVLALLCTAPGLLCMAQETRIGVHDPGPYLDKNGESLVKGGGTILLQGDKDWYGVGHNSAYTFDGKDYLVFHGYDAKDNGRSKLLIRILRWTAEGWPEVE